MRDWLRRLWDDDGGAVISTELVLIIGILVFGLIPGLVALRNSGIAVMATLGNLARVLIPSFTFSGFQILVGTPPNQTVIGQVGGVTFTPNLGDNLTADQVAPVTINAAQVVIPPAP